MKQRFKSVCLEGLGIALPPRVVTSDEIEDMLSPLYKRLDLPQGRLELMTGIQARRWGEKGLKPSDLSVEAGRKALDDAGIDTKKVGCLIHASVCRDFLEPATATVVHHKLGLSRDCQVFDLSNACLGWLDGWVEIATKIEMGQIECGLIVSGEDGRGLVETTIETLNQDTSLTRKTIKGRFASLTIGSGGVAAVLTSDSIAKKNHVLLGALSQCNTEHHVLCQGGLTPEESTRMSVDMKTDSETMLHAGVALGARTWSETRSFFGLTSDDVQHFVTHQVGSAHQRLLFEKLELDRNKDFSTYEELGNMGSASIGITLAKAAQGRRLKKGDGVMMMGIGSGLVSLMVGLKW